MSFLAGAGWQNATGSLVATPPAPQTISSKDIMTTSDDRKPLLPDPNADAASGKRYTFRGFARALPYFMRPTPAATTVSVASQDVQRPAVSSSPSQSVIDLQARVSVKQPNVVREELKGTDNGTTEREGSSVGHEGAESVQNKGPRSVTERRPSASSNATTVVTEEPPSISQSLDKQLDVEKPQVATNESALRERIMTLENENAKMLTKMTLTEESAAREKSDMMHTHKTELNNLRQEIRLRQESLDASQGRLKEIEGRFAEMAREKEILREDVTGREEALRVKDGQMNDLVAEKENLSGELQRLEENLSEKSALLEDAREQNAALEELKLCFARERAEMETEILRVQQSAEKALAELAGDYGNKMAEASNQIQKYHHELSNSTQLVDQLRFTLESSQRSASELSETANKRLNEILLQREQLSELQQVKRDLEQKVEEEQTRMRFMEENSAKTQTELRNQHASEIDAERKLVRNLQSSLESLQHDLMNKEDQLTKLKGTGEELRQKLGESEARCRKEEQRAEALDVTLAKANSEIRGLEEKAKLLREEATKEKTSLTNQANQLRRQLDGTQKLLSDRVEQVQRLETTKIELGNSLRRAQTVVNEKDLLNQNLQRKCTSLEETKKSLDGQVKDLEKTLVEVRQMAHIEHTKTVENHQREMMQATNRIQGLQDELSSFIATAQQLHASLETSQANTEKAERLSEDLGREVHDLRQHVSTLQDALHTLEVKSDETTSRLISNERSFREEKAGILRRHAIEIDSQRREALETQETMQRALKRKEESLSALAEQNNALHGEVMTLNQRMRKSEEDLNATEATLRDVTERSRFSLETLIDEKYKVEEEVERLRSLTEELRKELKDRREEIAKLKETSIKKMVSNVFVGFWHLLGTPSQLKDRAE